MADVTNTGLARSFSSAGIDYDVLGPVTTLRVLGSSLTSNGLSTTAPLSGPATILTLPPNLPGDILAHLKSRRDALLESRDDVWNENFLRSTVIAGTADEIGRLDLQTLSANLPWQASWIVAQSSACLPSGPYFLHGLVAHRVARLYEDPLDAFMFGVQSIDSHQSAFRECSPGRISVPSRLYYANPSLDRPLCGKRVAVKDIYHIKGTTTSASSRAFRSFYGSRDATAPMVQRLIDAGAVVVGKTRTAQFASGERTRDWVDYSCPFNPRGDGYLEPDGSSTGSAAAIAGYSWLDFSIGSDTLGSMVCPAASQGIFGIRPTHGLADLRDVVPVSERLDTAGFFSRSVSEAVTFSCSWYGQTEKMPEMPFRLLSVTEEFQKFHQDQRDIMEAFIQNLEDWTKAKVEQFDIKMAWSEASPAGSKASINDYLATTLARVQLWGSYHNSLPFRQAYKKQHGHEPYANPLVRFKWELGEKLGEEDFIAACAEQDIYRQFLREDVLTDTSTIIIYPGGSPDAAYRDAYFPKSLKPVIDRWSSRLDHHFINERPAWPKFQKE
ncbi:hypothetical protein FH972_023968 [Carpinus fangiana]|uniref:Amidase domain-containing protein n=1 Tax=Carpinus fangiana TaxID=176857 RepID=A0A5N6KX19_9ROSI|nr:hypothetical protein FH972_023968 [Carpinus fangiana]